MESLLTPSETADFLGVAEATLTHWRYKRSGPPSYKVGRHIRYRASEVEAWLSEQVSR